MGDGIEVPDKYKAIMAGTIAEQQQRKADSRSEMKAATAQVETDPEKVAFATRRRQSSVAEAFSQRDPEGVVAGGKRTVWDLSPKKVN
jgi:hypothetical protein